MSRKLFLLTGSGRRWQEVRAATSPPPVSLALPGAGSELDQVCGVPFRAAVAPASRGTPAPRRAAGQGEGQGRVVAPETRCGARPALAAESAKGTSPGTGILWRPLPGGHNSPPPPAEDSVLAPSGSRENEVKPPVHRVRQRDLLCGDLLALPDAGPGPLRLPEEPAARGFLSPGERWEWGREAPRGLAWGRCSFPLLRDPFLPAEADLEEDPSLL